MGTFLRAVKSGTERVSLDAWCSLKWKILSRSISLAVAESPLKSVGNWKTDNCIFIRTDVQKLGIRDEIRRKSEKNMEKRLIFLMNGSILSVNGVKGK